MRNTVESVAIISMPFVPLGIVGRKLSEVFSEKFLFKKKIQNFQKTFQNTVETGYKIA